MKNQFTEEEIMAYADGALDQSRSNELERVSRKDKHLQSRIELYRQTAGMAKTAIKHHSPEVSDTLRASIENLVARGNARSSSDNVVVLPARRAKPSWFYPSAIAASIALLVGFGAAKLQTVTPDSIELSLGPVGETRLAELLSKSITGQAIEIDNQQVAVIASFIDGNGHLCREFSVDTGRQKSDVAVACHFGAQWETLMVMAGRPSENTYSPAGSLQPVDTFLQSIGAATALTEKEELAALGSLPK